MVAIGNQSMIDFYPIVVELDDDTLDNSRSNRDSIYKTVASEASWFDSERSWRSGEYRVETEESISRKEHEDDDPPAQRRRKFGGSFLHKNPPAPPTIRRYHSCDPSLLLDCDKDVGHDTDVGGIFTTIRSLLQWGSHRNEDHTHRKESTNIESLDRNSAPKSFNHSNISPLPSPERMNTKRYRPRRFHDDYVLTQQIVQCRHSTLWECVHRTTGRRYCAKAIDKRSFGSKAGRISAAREVNMHRLTLQCSFPSCLPRVRDIYADGEAAEQIQQYDESISLASNESTRSVSSHSVCDDSQWYIVQDFEAGGGNLGLYLVGRENRIFDVPENGENDNVGTEIIIKNELHLPETSRTTLMTMQEPEVRSLARSLLLALNELHRRSICHNDLCLENILVPISPINHHTDGNIQQNQESEGCEPYSYHNRRHRRKKSREISSGGCWEDLKLCDLGRAFFVDSSMANAIPAGNINCEAIPRHSSIYYTSPEVIQGHSPDLASDMWSVGVILYRCFAGELPFREQSDVPSCLGYSRSLVHSSLPSSSSSEVPINPRLREQLKYDICHAKYNFGRSNRRITDPRWSRVSRGAKQFISALLNPSPLDRMTCDEALYHPWLMNGVSPQNWSTSIGSSVPSQPSPLFSKPVVKSSTTTNHYQHHPNYTTIAKKSLSHGANSRSEQDSYATTSCPSTDTANTSSPLADGSAPSARGRPKSFVRKFFGRRKTSNEKKSRYDPNSTANFVVD